MNESKKFNPRPILLPEECLEFMSSGHEWIRRHGKLICANCHQEKESSIIFGIFKAGEL